MKVFTVALIVALIALACARPEEKYTTKYDNIDLDEILKSDRLLGNYVNCALDRGKCTPDGAELKRVLPDALKSECSKCSEKQKEGSKKVIRHLIKNKDAWWKELQAKYDPEGIYQKQYDAEIKTL